MMHRIRQTGWFSSTLAPEKADEKAAFPYATLVVPYATLSVRLNTIRECRIDHELRADSRVLGSIAGEPCRMP